MARISDIVIDSLHPSSLARFWGNALDGYTVRTYDEEEIRRLESLGFTPETDPAVAVDGPGPTLFFQKTDTRKNRRNRVHLDLCGGVGVDEVDRLCVLGASVRDVHSDHTVLEDPEGNEFCLRDPKSEDPPAVESRYIAGNPEMNPDKNSGAAMVVVSGCSGGGKSALLEEMAARGYPVHPEPGRQIVKEQLHIGGDGLPWGNAEKFIELCVSRGMYFYNVARSQGKPVLFDRSMLDNISGFKRLGMPVPSDMKEVLKRYRYANRIFMVPPWRELFANDAERRHSFESAQREYEGLLVAYADHDYETVVIPKASVAERADFLEEALR